MAFEIIKVSVMTGIGIAMIPLQMTAVVVRTLSSLWKVPGCLIRSNFKLARNEVLGVHRRPIPLNELVLAAEGFQFEEHKILTEDGYILTIHRINMHDLKQERGERKPKPVIYMQHGLKCSSADYIHGGGLALEAARKGYDVWLGNVRGNHFGQQHIRLSKSCPEFWDFSWDEMAKFDLPSCLDYVMEKTGVSKVTFLGHSMGTTICFTMLNYFPERNSHIKTFIALAPVTRAAHMGGIPFWLAPFMNLVTAENNCLGLHSMVVTKQLPLYSLVSSLVTFIIGYHKTNLDDLQTILSHSPSGCSTKTVQHFLRCYHNQSFASYNGEIMYTLCKVTCPVDIYYSKDDWACNDKAATLIREQLPNCQTFFQVESLPFGHLDFLWSTEASSCLYPKIFSNLEEDSLK